MSTLKKLAGQTVIYGMSHIMPRILNFVVMTIYLTYRLPDTKDFGIFSDLYSYSTIILALMVFRMDTAYFRFGSRNDENSDKVYATAFLPMAFISIIITILLLFFNQEVAQFLGYGQRPEYISWFAGILGLDAFTTLVYAKFRLDSRPIRFLFYRVANVIFTVLILLFFLEFLPRYFPDFKMSCDRVLGVKKDLDYAFLANLFASISVFMLMIPEFLKIELKFDKILYKKMLIYVLPLVIVGVTGAINQYVSVPLQKMFLKGNFDENMSVAGIYSAAAKLAILLNLFTTAFNYAAEPFFFNNAAKEKSEDVYGKVALAYTIFAGLVVLATYFYIDIVLLLIGEGYRSGVNVVPVLLMSYLFLGLFYNLSIWYKLADKTWYGAYISVAASLITIVMSATLLPVIGYMASAWASLACFVFMVISAYILGQKYYPIEYPVKKILFQIFTVSVLMIISFLLRNMIESKWIIVGINTLLLLLYSYYLFITEKTWAENLIQSLKRKRQ